jgi:glycogen debranching enzyme
MSRRSSKGMRLIALGCIAQAWSVAEILRVYSEELRGLWPNTPPCASALSTE